MTIFDARLVLDSPALRREQDHLVRAFALAEKEALTETARDGEQQLEALTRAAVGGKLWRAWASKHLPDGYRGKKGQAAIIYLKGGARTRGAIEFLTRSGRVKSGTERGWLAISLPGAGVGRRGRRLSFSEWKERNPGTDLSFVKAPDGRSVLVVAKGRTGGTSGRFRAFKGAGTAADQRRGFRLGEQSVPIFVLIPPFAFSGRVSVEHALASLDEDLARRFAARVAQIAELRAAS